MRNRVLVILVLIVLAGLLIYQREVARRKMNPRTTATVVKPAAVESLAIEGSYRTDGQNPDGSAYTGSLAIEKKGDRFSFLWKEGKTELPGVGFRQDSIIAVTYAQKDKIRTAVYKIGLGKLDGRWLAFGDSLFGREVCTKQ